MLRHSDGLKLAANDASFIAPPKDALDKSFSTGSFLELRVNTSTRKIGHVRSESAYDLPRSTDRSRSQSVSPSDDDDESDVEWMFKPQIVRKKSGELVRPALRPTYRRRPSSMPGTPTFAKAVHFDSRLEHVRHFLQVDRPLAVSAGTSPNDYYDSDTEYPFPSEPVCGSAERPHPLEWEIIINLPADSEARLALPVRLEKVWLSPDDQKSFIGTIAVSNIAFHKHVSCRFTLDYWKTVSEVSAHYSQEISPSDNSSVGQDRFTFAIKMSDISNLETKTLFFCLHYVVAGQEFWDNNSAANFQVDFRTKHLPLKMKNGLQSPSGRSVGILPRSNKRASAHTATALRSKMKTVSLDESDDQSSNGLNLRFKAKSTSSLASDSISNGLGVHSGQAFSNRYDFSASLRAAKDAGTKDNNGDGLYMKLVNRREQPSSGPPPTPKVARTVKDPISPRAGSPRDSTTSGLSKQPETASSPATNSPSSILTSSSYEELLNKYCFFGSKQAGHPTKDGEGPQPGSYDGADDVKTKSNTTYTPGPWLSQYSSSQSHHLRRTVSANSSPPRPEVMSAAVSFPVNTSAEFVEGEATVTRTSVTHSPNSTFGGLKSGSPTSTFGPLASALSNDMRYHLQHPQDRFPFFKRESHTATPIRG